MIGVVLFSIGIFVCYLGCIIYKYGVPSSVSESFYLLPKKYNWLFTIFCWGVASIIAPWLESSAETWEFLSFLSCAGLVFVGTAAAFKEDFVRQVHYVAAAICAVCSQLWIILDTDLEWISILVFVLVGCLGYWHWLKRGGKGDSRVSKNVTFWVELWAFVSLFVVMLVTWL